MHLPIAVLVPRTNTEPVCRNSYKLPPVMSCASSCGLVEVGIRSWAGGDIESRRRRGAQLLLGELILRDDCCPLRKEDEIGG